MHTYSSNARNAHAYASIGVQTGVVSASPPQLILMLYDGALAAIASAQQHLRLKNIAAKGEAISKAISIIDDGLKASLDLGVGGELAKNLSDLYLYVARRLLHANLRNDLAALEEAHQLLLQLRSAWESLARSAAASTSAPALAAQSARPATSGPSPVNRVAAAYGSV